MDWRGRTRVVDSNGPFRLLLSNFQLLLSEFTFLTGLRGPSYFGLSAVVFAAPTFVFPDPADIVPVPGLVNHIPGSRFLVWFRRWTNRKAQAP